jgi:hypothetical protein
MPGHESQVFNQSAQSLACFKALAHMQPAPLAIDLEVKLFSWVVKFKPSNNCQKFLQLVLLFIDQQRPPTEKTIQINNL